MDFRGKNRFHVTTAPGEEICWIILAQERFIIMQLSDALDEKPEITGEKFLTAKSNEKSKIFTKTEIEKGRASQFLLFQCYTHFFSTIFKEVQIIAVIDLDCKYTDVVIQFVVFKNKHTAACNPIKIQL
ncbi:uncharacterized protein ACN2A1_013462 isoform 1-T1 [Glossina fuscipes fuscipes]